MCVALNAGFLFQHLWRGFQSNILEEIGIRVRDKTQIETWACVCERYGNVGLRD